MLLCTRCSQDPEVADRKVCEGMREEKEAQKANLQAPSHGRVNEVTWQFRAGGA